MRNNSLTIVWYHSYLPFLTTFFNTVKFCKGKSCSLWHCSFWDGQYCPRDFRSRKASLSQTNRLLRSSHVCAQRHQYTCNPPPEPRNKKPNQKDTKQLMHKSTMKTATDIDLHPPWRKLLFVCFKLTKKKHVAIKKIAFLLCPRKWGRKSGI